jgi:signal transduction histidine kinase
LSSLGEQSTNRHDSLKTLYRRHVQGAAIRAGASFTMWLTSLIAYWLGLIHRDNFISNCIAVTCLIAMNPPVLLILRRIKTWQYAKYFSLCINLLEIIGYTAVIHALGGVEATYLTPIYAALIIYIGVMGTRWVPFVIAGLCSTSFGMMLLLEHLGILRTLKINPSYDASWTSQLGILSVDTTLLFVVAFISSYTAQLLKKNRDKLSRQNRELQLAVHKAQAADRLKSEFLSNVSHELRTPLNAIIGFSELLQDQYLGELNEKQKESVISINTSGAHLLSIVSDLLDLGKLEAGKMELALSDIDLKALVENSLSMVKRSAEERGIRLSADTDDCPETMRADELRIRQILYNLLSNATKFIGAGGEVRLSAHYLYRTNSGWQTKKGEEVAVPGFGSAGGSQPARIVDISVADTGIGLEEVDLQRIFNPFEQVDGSKSRRYQGAGLGLSLTKRLVELHHGTIWAVSEGKGKGSTFHCVIRD